MICGVGNGSSFFRRVVVSPSRGKLVRHMSLAPARQRVVSRSAEQFNGAFNPVSGQAHAPPALGLQEEANIIPKKNGVLRRIFGKESCVAPPDFKNRWAMFAPAFLTHVCIGSPWAWSMMSHSLHRELGVVSSAAADWSLAEATLPMSLVFAMQGISAAVGSKWALDVGPRLSMTVASICFGGGMIVGGLGIEHHSLPMLYAGYGMLSGVGVGLAYTPPVQALISWFPDKKGLASGLTIAGSGSGALVFTPMIMAAKERFSEMPTYLGAVDQVSTVVKDGKLFADTISGMFEVVEINTAQLARVPYDIAEGLYVVGTGSTGAGSGLALCGAVYGVVMLTSAMMIKTPAPGYKVPGYDLRSPAGATGKGPTEENNVDVKTAIRTPQFYALAATFFGVAFGGMGLFSVAKPMMGEVFSTTMPALVTVAFASNYVQVLSMGNLSGRIGWAAFSDKFGRKLTVNLFCLGSIPMYFFAPYIVQDAVSTVSIMPLGVFIGSMLVAMTFMGGTYAVLPAYVADLFGPKYVGPIYGRLLLASSAAALAGPSILQNLRTRSEMAVISDLLDKADPVRFKEVFSTGVEDAQVLIKTKALTIHKLMEMMPEGTIDPTPFIYNSTMYTMAGMVGVAAVAHFMVKPMDPKHYEKVAPVKVESILKFDVGPATVVEGGGMSRSMYSHMIPASALPRNPLTNGGS